MKLIENFYCIQSEIFGNGSQEVLAEGIVSIKQELIRPIIRFINENGTIQASQDRKTYRKRLIANPYTERNEYFTKDELFFLSKTYDFHIEEDTEYKGYYSSILKNNAQYKSSGDIILIEENNKEYLMIEFTRWQFDYQPRGAGEDSLGEDVTYILGIWESPLLTNEIVSKIKNDR